jgi:hypothetical protein
MRIATLLAATAVLFLPATAWAQYAPWGGYAWYPSYYGGYYGGYYRAPYYGGGMGPSCGYYGCGYHPYRGPGYMRSGFGDYREYRHVAHHYYYRTRHPVDVGGEFGIGW